MPVYISLLRGINVSGRKKIHMEDLRHSYASLGFNRVRTHIQSGNVIFITDEQDTEELARRIEKKISNDYGFFVDIFLKSAAEYGKILRNNPFLPDRKEELQFLHVTFLKNRPRESLVTAVPDVPAGGEEFVISGRSIYLYCPNGYGRARFTNKFFEKKFDVPATTRNWNTAMKLLDLSRDG